MTSVARETRTLMVAMPLLLAAATVGFWGNSVIDRAAATSLPTPRAENWLADPLPPIVLDAAARAILERQPLADGPAADANPFLTAAEGRGARVRQSASPDGSASAVAAPPATSGWPSLRAVISLDGRASVLLDAASPVDGTLWDAPALRVGDRLEGLEILEIAGQHVLVKGEEGHKWLHLSSP